MDVYNIYIYIFFFFYNQSSFDHKIAYKCACCPRLFDADMSRDLVYRAVNKNPQHQGNKEYGKFRVKVKFPLKCFYFDFNRIIIAVSNFTYIRILYIRYKKRKILLVFYE